MSRLEMRFLGGLTLQHDDGLLTDIKSQKGVALICYLAVSQKKATRPFLAALFWPDMPENQALMNLRKVLQRLQPLRTYLVITRETVDFNQDADYCLDVAEFEEETATSSFGTAKGGSMQAVPQDIIRLQKAIDLYQGDFLDGFMLADAPLFEEWVLAQRARLREVALAALQRLIAHFGEEGGYETAVAFARQLLTIEPWHEETHRELMHLLALSGQRSAALAQYESCCRLLADELGVEPAAATVQLVEQIKTGELGRRAGERGSGGDGLPLHNLPPQMTPFAGRQLELARLQELLAEPDVHLITILGTGGMGKTRLALALAERMLSSLGGHKTHPYQNGVYFASLARLESADLLLPAIAEAINFRFAEGDNQQEQLLRYLVNKSMLLVLDNFEHLLALPVFPPTGGSSPASPPLEGIRGGEELVDEILRAAPRVKVIITSRVRLNRQVEQLFPIGGMAYPPVKGAASQDSTLEVRNYSAVQLFVQCAQRVRPDFGLTAANQLHVLKICHRLQGMPLGIVLAASWLESLSTKAISREMQQDIDFLATDMEDVPQRQRSLRAAFNHSWRLLSEREREIFRQMSIFRGGFTRAAAQAVTGATLPDLQALVNKSLLTLAPERRYDVHELLRQFAAEKLSEVVEVETAVRDRHSGYYCTLLQQHTPNWHNARQLETLAEVTREADNIQAAWGWALQYEAWQRLYGAIDSWCWYHQWRGLRAVGEAFCQAICICLEHWAMAKPADTAAGYRLWAKALAWYGEFAMPILVAAQWLQQSLALLAHPELADDDTRPVEAFALLCLGGRLTGFNRQEARSYLERSLPLYEALQASWGIGKALGSLSSLDWSIGDYSLAQQRAEASLDIHQKRGDQWEEMDLLGLMGWIYQHLGQLAKAEQLRHKVLDLCRRFGDRQHLAGEMASLAYTVGWQGRFDEGKQWAEKSITICQEDGYLDNEGFAYLALGWSLSFAGQYEQAQQALTHSLALEREINNNGVEATVHYALGNLALLEMAYDKAQTNFEESLRLYQVIQGDAYTFLALSGLGFVTCCRGDLDQSSHYFIELLTDGLKRKDFLWVLSALPGMSLYLLKRGKGEQALTVWTQALCQPHIANSPLYEDMVGQSVREETADFPPHIIEEAQANGRSQDIWHMAESLLADLQSGR
jgi:predicted ATPase/DNA-binding SARP family transcriptional activator